MSFDTEKFYTETEPMHTSWGYSGDKVTVFDKATKIPLSSYYGSFHPDHELYWEKRFAADLAVGKFAHLAVYSPHLTPTNTAD